MPKIKTAGNIKSVKPALPPGRDKYFSRAVSKALEVIEFLAPQNEMRGFLQTY
jgi:hypothetical protein